MKNKQKQEIIKLKFIGADDYYVEGYPRRDLETYDRQVADYLIETGCYEAVTEEETPNE